MWETLETWGARAGQEYVQLLEAEVTGVAGSPAARAGVAVAGERDDPVSGASINVKMPLGRSP